MVTIDIEVRPQLRCTARHAPSGERLATDAPTDNRGRGASFSPTDLVATALGTCLGTILSMAAEDRGLDLSGTRIRVDKHRVQNPRRIGRLAVEVRVPSDPGPAVREALERAARGCPVAASLAPDLELDLAFRWGD